MRLTTRAFIQAVAGADTPHSNLRHLLTLQRPNLALQVGQVHANSLLQRLLRRQSGAGESVIRRVPVNIGGGTVNTCGEAVPLINMVLLQLKPEMPEVPQSHPAYVAAALVVQEGELYVTNLGGQADQEVDADKAAQLNGWYAVYNHASDALNTYQKVQAAEKIKQAVASSTALEARADSASGQFDFPLEQAFRQNDTTRLTKLKTGITALATAKSETANLKQALMQVYSLVITPGIKATALEADLKPLYDQIKEVGATYSIAKASSP